MSYTTYQRYSIRALRRNRSEFITGLTVVFITFILINYFIFSTKVFSSYQPKQTKNKSLEFLIRNSNLQFFASGGTCWIDNSCKIGEGDITDHSAATTKAQKRNTIHIVKVGEYLWKIAEYYYGDGFMQKKIIEANKLKPPFTLEKGQKLIIP